MVSNKINVVYITDENYAMPTCISAFSLISNQSSKTESDIYFVVNNISEDSKKKLRSLETGNAKIHIIEVKDQSYSEMAKSCLAYQQIHVSYTALFKFDLPQLLPEVDQVLYLDGDTLIQSDLSDLYHTSLEGYYVAAVEDLIQKLKSVSPIYTDDSYFNSGVMLLNLKKMREDSITDKLIDYRVHGLNYFMDQDALNAVLGVKKKKLPQIYNFLTSLINNFDVDEMKSLIDLEAASSIEEIVGKVTILHLTDRTKPWIYYMPWFTEIFKEYYEKSPYAGEKLTLMNPLKEQTFEVLMLRNRIDELNNRLHSRNSEYRQPYEERLQGKRVVLYGAGKRGQSIRGRLDTLCEVVAWVDKNHEIISSRSGNELKQVQSPEVLRELDFERVMIAIMDQRMLMDAKQYLMEGLGIPREKIVTLYERRYEDKIVKEISDLYRQWKGREHELASQYIGKFSNVACRPRVRNIAMIYKWLTIGGVQRVVAMLSGLLCEMGYHITIILDSADEMAYELPEGVEVVTVPGENGVQSTGNYWHRAVRLREIIRKKKIDAVIHHGASSPILLYDLLLCKRSNLYFMCLKHEMFSQYMAYRSDTLYAQQTVFQLVDRLVVLGQDECNFWKVQGSRAVYISNPMGEYAVSEKRTDTGHYILWLGRLARMQKQCLDVVPIMREVVKQIPDAVLKIYGNEVAPGILKELKEQIEKNQLEENIQYCGYAEGNLGEIYRNAAVFLVTSEYESFPLTIYESKLNGVPLVTYRMPYLEQLKDEKGYIAVENDNTKQAASAIVRILQDEELGKRLSQEAKESVVRFDNTAVKRDWKELLEDLTSGKEIEKKTYTAEEMKILLETMLYHYHKGLRLDSRKEFTQRQGMAAVLEYYCRWKNLPPVIYPFGTVGKRVQQMLREQLHIEEAFVVDNGLSKTDSSIKSVEDLKTIDCSRYLFFICSKIPRQHDEIMKGLKGIVPENNIVDLYPSL